MFRWIPFPSAALPPQPGMTSETYGTVCTSLDAGTTGIFAKYDMRSAPSPPASALCRNLKRLTHKNFGVSGPISFVCRAPAFALSLAVSANEEKA